MKSKTILIAIICTFLLLMLPNVNAIEYKEIEKEVESKIAFDFKEFNNQIKYLINTLTNGIVINILLLLLFVYELFILIFFTGAVFIIGYEWSFIEKLFMIILAFISINIDNLYYGIEDIMDLFNLDWFPFYNIVKILRIIIELIWRSGDG